MREHCDHVGLNPVWLRWAPNPRRLYHWFTWLQRFSYKNSEIFQIRKRLLINSHRKQFFPRVGIAYPVGLRWTVLIHTWSYDKRSRYRVISGCPKYHFLKVRRLGLYLRDTGLYIFWTNLISFIDQVPPPYRCWIIYSFMICVWSCVSRVLVKPSAVYGPVRHLSPCPHLVFDPHGIGASSFISSTMEPHLSLSTFLSALASSFISLSLFRISDVSSFWKYPISAWKTLEFSKKKLDRNILTCVKSNP